MASACCWLPLLLLAIGISGVGVAGIFEQYRPIFLTGTFALLTLTWYLTHQATVRRWLARQPTEVSVPSSESNHACCAIQPDEESAAGESCCATAPGQRRRFTIRQFNSVMLWLATAVILVFAFFPHWIGFVLRAGSRGNASAVELTWHEVRIEGMTCEGCAATLEKRAQAKVAAIDAKMRDLQAMRDALLELMAECSGRGPVACCPIIESLAGGPGSLAKEHRVTARTRVQVREGSGRGVRSTARVLSKGGA